LPVRFPSRWDLLKKTARAKAQRRKGKDQGDEGLFIWSFLLLAMAIAELRRRLAMALCSRGHRSTSALATSNLSARWTGYQGVRRRSDPAT